jgi:hypothetical protein
MRAPGQKCSIDVDTYSHQSVYSLQLASKPVHMHHTCMYPAEVQGTSRWVQDASWRLIDEEGRAKRQELDSLLFLGYQAGEDPCYVKLVGLINRKRYRPSYFLQYAKEVARISKHDWTSQINPERLHIRKVAFSPETSLASARGGHPPRPCVRRL